MIRVYIVVIAVTFYNQYRKEPTVNNSLPLPLTASLMNGSFKETTHKDVGNSTMRKLSIATESIVGDEEAVNAEDFKIQAADMPIHMQRAALNGAIQACRLYTTEKHIAESIKQDFDQMFTPTWHCIVGRNWGSCVTHSKQCYIRILHKDMTILLYKST